MEDETGRTYIDISCGEYEDELAELFAGAEPYTPERTPWTEREDRILMYGYRRYSVDDMLRLLPGRTDDAMRARWRKLRKL